MVQGAIEKIRIGTGNIGVLSTNAGAGTYGG